MKLKNQSKPFSDHWHEFVQFTGTFWGILALASVFLPLLNYFSQVIPAQKVENQGVLVWFSIGLFTILSLLINVFILFGAFTYRQKSVSQPELASFQRQSLSLLASGIAAVLIYLAGYFFIHDSGLLFWGCNEHEICRLVVEAALLFFYVGFFASITRAFALLALAYYLHHDNH
ncbi:MAG: hypothetical protein WHV66_08715 [Anaerolineales bacterium]